MSSTSHPAVESSTKPDPSFIIEDRVLTPLRFASDTLEQLEALFAAMQAIADSPQGAIATARIDKLHKLAEIGRSVATMQSSLVLSATETLLHDWPALLRASKHETVNDDHEQNVTTDAL